MNLFYEIYWYRFWWLLFIAIAFVAARYWSLWGVLLGAVSLAIIIYILDFLWITDDMRNHPENERDLDFIFLFGVILWVILFNVVLLPVTFLGLKVRARRLRAKMRGTIG